MILGYPEESSVFPGSSLILHVSTDAPVFRVDFYRQETTLLRVHSSDWIPGQYAPIPTTAKMDLGWPPFRFTIPGDWPSGVYLAMFTEADGLGQVCRQPTAPPPDPSGRGDRPDAFGALFVIRNPTPGREALILYKLPLFTYHAYNTTASGNLYDFGPTTVTMRRPGGGIGGYYRHADSTDAYDGDSRRQTFAHWDAKFISWLYQRGYRTDFCTDLDIHGDTGILDNYRLLLSVGHDEYWTQKERRNVETFIARGGNVAFFGGNTCWWRVEVVDHDTGLSIDKRRARWSDPEGINDPENAITGVSYGNGGGWWEGPREDVSYTVYNSNHWVYEGTHAVDQDPIGKGSHLVGYEADGAALQIDRGVPVLTGADGTPSSFMILGLGVLGPGWQCDFIRPNQVRAATMGLYTRDGASVFTAATTDWARVLASGDPMVDRITRNVIDRLSAPPVAAAPTTRLDVLTGEPFVAISVCTRNRVSALRRCLESVQQSTLEPTQILVSDDGDSDQASQVEALCATFRGVTYVAGPRRGLAANRNHCIAHLDPSIAAVVFLDDDAALRPGFLDQAVIALASLPSRTILSGRELVDGVDMPPGNCSFWGHQEVVPRAPDDYHGVAMNATVFPRELFHELAFDEALLYGSEEADICAQAEQAGYRIVYRPELVNDHFRSPIGREDQQRLAEVSRLYSTYKRYRWLEGKRAKATTFAILAPLHLLAGLLVRGKFADVPAAVSSIGRALAYVRTEGKRRREVRCA